jgi:sec-independent protein translocase protein TatB
MFGLSFGEIVIIAIVALLLLGPDKLPEAAKTLGKGLREIRKATDELKDQVEKEINLSELMADKPTPPKPSLVPPVPAREIPGASGPPPAATAENVPGLELALAEPITVAEEASSASSPPAASGAPAAGEASAPAPSAAPSTPNTAQGS